MATPFDANCDDQANIILSHIHHVAGLEHGGALAGRQQQTGRSLQGHLPRQLHHLQTQGKVLGLFDGRIITSSRSGYIFFLIQVRIPQDLTT